MRQSRVRKRWAEGKPVLVTVSHFMDPQSPELIGLMGFDCVWVDLEHQAVSIKDFENLARAARVNDMDIMARPAKGEFMRMGRLLEAGANLIMYPRCESEEDAKQFVRYAKFPPLGERGFFSGSPDNPYSLMPMTEYLEAANRETILIAQVESPHAVTQAEAIASVEGVDMLFFGPGDFSIAAGVPGQFHSDIVQNAIAETAKSAIRAGKRFGTLVPDAAYAKQLLDMGATFIGHMGDMQYVRAGLEKVRRDFGEIGFPFAEVCQSRR